jgi:hypothetical protein
MSKEGGCIYLEERKSELDKKSPTSLARSAIFLEPLCHLPNFKP